jgi:hypothetical protein
VRGYGLTIDRNPSPGSHLAMRSDLSHKGTGELSRRQNRFNQKPSRSGLTRRPVRSDLIETDGPFAANRATSSVGSRQPVGLAYTFARCTAVLLIVALGPGAGLAEKLVDPNSVAPQFREIAEKRRAEQVKLFQCTKKADEAKVLRRDRAAFVGQCLDR